MKPDRKTKTFVNKYSKKTIRYYTMDELRELKPIFKQAEEMWQTLAEEYGKDEGHCVLGDYIRVYTLPPRCQHVREIDVVRSPGFQGGTTKERTVGPVLEFLKAQGIDCWHHHGRVD